MPRRDDPGGHCAAREEPVPERRVLCPSACTRPLGSPAGPQKPEVPPGEGSSHRRGFRFCNSHVFGGSVAQAHGVPTSCVPLRTAQRACSVLRVCCNTELEKRSSHVRFCLSMPVVRPGTSHFRFPRAPAPHARGQPSVPSYQSCPTSGSRALAACFPAPFCQKCGSSLSLVPADLKYGQNPFPGPKLGHVDGGAAREGRRLRDSEDASPVLP